jgi:hypothetical protein
MRCKQSKTTRFGGKECLILSLKSLLDTRSIINSKIVLVLRDVLKEERQMKTCSTKPLA